MTKENGKKVAKRDKISPFEGQNGMKEVSLSTNL